MSIHNVEDFTEEQREALRVYHAAEDMKEHLRAERKRKLLWFAIACFVIAVGIVVIWWGVR